MKRAAALVALALFAGSPARAEEATLQSRVTACADKDVYVRFIKAEKEANNESGTMLMLDLLRSHACRAFIDATSIDIEARDGELVQFRPHGEMGEYWVYKSQLRSAP
jgi:hypothetical protein